MVHSGTFHGFPNSAPSLRATRVLRFFRRKTRVSEFPVLSGIGANFAMVLIMALFSGCGCNYHLRRASAKCPFSESRDTVYVHDTLRFDEVRIDTVAFLSRDTITITKDRLKIKVVRLPGDSVYIYGKCDSIYVNRFIKVPYTKTVYKFDWWIFIRRNILWIILIIAALAGLRRLTKR